MSMNVEHWPTTKPIPYARNARVVPDAAIGKVAASIKEFGFKQPIVVDAEGVIVVGHTRLLAAQRLGMESVPVIVAADLTPAQVKAYRLADNRTAQETSWDEELLLLELEDLADLEFDVSLTGFEADEVRAMGGEDGEPAPPRASLADRFGVPPFSVLDARQGYWQERKRAWLALGIRSELGRGGGLTLNREQVTEPGLNYYRKRGGVTMPAPSARTSCGVSIMSGSARAGLLSRRTQCCRGRGPAAGRRTAALAPPSPAVSAAGAPPAAGSETRCEARRTSHRRPSRRAAWLSSSAAGPCGNSTKTIVEVQV